MLKEFYAFDMLELNLLDYQDQLRVKREDGKTYLFDPIRKTWLLLLPEEMVRQLFLQYLIIEKTYPKSLIKVEFGLQVHHQLQKRSDLLVYNRASQPFLLVECKAPEVKINEKALWQIANYNSTFQAAYLVLTNGVSTYCCKMDYVQQKHEMVAVIPDFPIEN